MLRRLAVGQVSAPFETLFGWEILRRTAARPRETYAMTPIEVPFGVSTQASGGNQGSAAAARAKAQSIADASRAHPERFDVLQKSGCCSSVSQWVDGRGPEELMATLRSLRLGEIAPQPLRLGFSYVVAKRVAPVARAEPGTRFDLSWPEL